MLRERRADGIAWVTFDRPEKLNAFRVDDYRDLRDVVERAADDASVRVIVLTGSGRAFSAGADRTLVDGSASANELEQAGIEFRMMLEALAVSGTPVLAAVNGLAVGFGCTLLLHCDLVLVAASARLRLPFTALGIVPEAGSSALLPMRARWPDAAWTMLSSEWFDADDAVAMGLAWRVVPDDDLLAETTRAASSIASHDPAAVAATKRLLTAGRLDVVRAAMAREGAELSALPRGG